MKIILMNLLNVNKMDNKWKKTFMKIAYIISEHSTCVRKQVGAILVKDKRIISIGYNGVISGKMHCCEIFKNIDLHSPEFYKKHGEWSANNEIHSEVNAIIWAAKQGIKIKNSDIFITLSPCINCAKLLVQSSIKNVYYNEIYDRDQSGIAFLKTNNINVEQIII
jgi:dCMP deaminase